MQLENVVFQWISDSLLIPKMNWNKFLELIEFKKEWGHYNVPSIYDQ